MNNCRGTQSISTQWDDKLRHDKKLMNAVESVKQRSFLARKSSTKAIVLFGKRGRELPIFVTDHNKSDPERVSAMEVLHLLKATPNEKAVAKSKAFKDRYEAASNKLFKRDKLPDNKGRRGEAINVLDGLKKFWPEAKHHCEDAKNIIKDLDGFPDGVLKRIANLQKEYFKDKDFRGAYNELMRIAPIKYMTALQSRARGQVDEPETLLIAEELV